MSFPNPKLDSRIPFWPFSMKSDLAWTKESKGRFREQIKEEGCRAYFYACLLSAVLWPAGSVLDWFTSQAHFLQLTFIRWVTGAIFLGLYFFSSHLLVRRWPYVATLLITILGSFSITLMCLIQDGYVSPYYAGINSIVIALGLLLPYEPGRTAGLVVVALLTYWIPVGFQAGFHFEHPDSFVNNFFFLTLSSFLVICAAAMRTSLKRQLFERQANLESANRKLKHYDRMRSDFFSNISHEFRTPLTLILGYLDRLSAPNLKPEDAAATGLLIRSNALIVLRHVNDLLDLSKLEVGMMSLSRSQFSLSDLLRRLAELFQLSADDRGIEFTVDVPESSADFFGDLEKVERVILNLLSNAFKFIGDGKQIRLSLAEEPGRFIIEVEDEGVGIPEGQRERVFDRFYQADGGDARLYGGTGLGLSIVKEFIDLHGGSVSIHPSKRSLEGRGTLVRIELPKVATDKATALSSDQASQTQLTEFADRRSVSTMGAISHAASQTLDVLIVEDNRQMRIFLESEVSKSFSVLSASSAMEALSILETRKPALILCDLMMPQMSGVDFFAKVSENDDLKQIPFLFLTAKADDEIKVQMLRLGAYDYLVKPFVTQELMAKIKNVLTMARSRQVLQRELQSSHSDLDLLTMEIIDQKQKLEVAVQSALLARDEALEASQAKSKFLGFISHELRNPLAAVRLNAQTLREGAQHLTPDLQEKLLNNLKRSADQLHELIESLLGYARIQRGRFQPKASQFSVADLIQEVIGDIGHLLQSKDLEVKVEVSMALVAQTDRSILKMILSNLLSNAVKYTPHGFVTIRAWQEASKLILSVQDSGIGIEAGSIEKIFEEFERLSSPKSFVPGIGLGLSLVKALVVGLHGSISVQSKPEEGACFTVVLPDAVKE